MGTEVLITKLQELYTAIGNDDQIVILIATVVFVYIMFLRLTSNRKKK